MRARFVVVALLLAGCATPLGMFGVNDQAMVEAAKTKDATVLCAEADVMLGAHKGSLVMAVIAKGISALIRVDGRAKCAVEITTDGGAR